MILFTLFEWWFFYPLFNTKDVVKEFNQNISKDWNYSYITSSNKKIKCHSIVVKNQRYDSLWNKTKINLKEFKSNLRLAYSLQN